MAPAWRGCGACLVAPCPACTVRTPRAAAPRPTWLLRQAAKRADGSRAEGAPAGKASASKAPAGKAAAAGKAAEPAAAHPAAEAAPAKAEPVKAEPAAAAAAAGAAVRTVSAALAPSDRAVCKRLPAPGSMSVD